MNELKKVERAAAKVTAAIAERDAAIIEARAKGHSLRKVAEAAGLSHESVRHTRKVVLRPSAGR